MNKIKIISILRFVDYKIDPLMSFINQLEVLENSVFEIHIVGNGSKDFSKRLNLKNVTIICHGKLYNQELNKLINQMDMSFCMGTSALVTSSNSLPTILSPYGGMYKNKYIWIYETTDFNMYMSDPEKGRNINDIFYEFFNNDSIGKKCLNYVLKNHSSHNTMNILNKYITKINVTR